MSEIGIVGGGLMGCLAGIRLERAGHRVTLLERRPQLLDGASRRNEGKIHRGYTYGLDPTGETARILAQRGAEFAPLLAEAVGPKAADIYLEQRQWYVMPRTSALDIDGAERHIRAVAALDPEHGEAGVSRVSEHQVRRWFSDEIIAAFEVPEASVDCMKLCDLVRATVEDTSIEVRTGIDVSSITDDDRPTVRAEDGTMFWPFDVVINAAWDGMPAIERRAGAMMHPLCLRAKVGFVTEVIGPVPNSSVTFVYGSFGDLVPQGGSRAYISWYPSALMGLTTQIEQGAAWFDDVAAGFDFARCYEESCAAFSRLIPGLRFADQPLETRAGTILAAGATDISDPQSQLHGRAKSGLYHRGNVIAVDTGKLTTAPSLARDIERLLG